MRLSAHAAAVLLGALAACGTPRSGAPGAASSPAGGQPRPEVLVARARALRAEGDVAGARARLETALAAAPASDDARLELADLLLADATELDRAAALLAGVRAPWARAQLLSARLAELRGDDAGAAACYARALEAGDDPDARLRRALALDRLGR
ncbi:MAG TPA: tetratricopeptide repeat protein, partial [Anaeromyxobacter sp.]|nr:tetratricopeptide repeat protein [Anaeromyxobacter sp.]